MKTKTSTSAPPLIGFAVMVSRCLNCGHEAGCDCDCCPYPLPANALAFVLRFLGGCSHG